MPPNAPAKGRATAAGPWRVRPVAEFSSPRGRSAAPARFFESRVPRPAAGIPVFRSRMSGRREVSAQTAKRGSSPSPQRVFASGLAVLLRRPTRQAWPPPPAHLPCPSNRLALPASSRPPPPFPGNNGDGRAPPRKN